MYSNTVSMYFEPFNAKIKKYHSPLYVQLAHSFRA